MPNDTLEALERAVSTARGISFEKKAELFALLGDLRRELAARPCCGAAHRRSAELRESVAAFENNHPDLVELTNRACKMLSDIGV